jgi:cob(I)alamin adenosyltransferase
VLDEVTYPVKYGWIAAAEVAGAIRDRAPRTSVVATGRAAPPELIDVADTVTEMRKIKHAYDAGISALKGIEF